MSPRVDDRIDSPIAERRRFLESAAMVGGALQLTLSGVHAAETNTANGLEPPRKVVVGIMGLSRGQALARTFASQPQVEVRYLCDVDSRRVATSVAAMQAAGYTSARGLADFRKMFDDPELDALVCAAPNHWHAPATILACQAGKHVYVEKPCCHNPWEGELMVRVARRHQRVVQMGSQRRSSPGTRQAMERLHQGRIGRVYAARAYYASLRGSIGHGKPAAPPAELDYALWQGPAPRRDYLDNVVHYNWHWRWHWGNGELGNNGIHTLDLCRWGLQVEYPEMVVASGGRYAYDDDQETADTHVAAFTFPNRSLITWQGLSCNQHSQDFVTFYGTEGTLELHEDGTHRILDRNDKLVEESTQSEQGESLHVANFLSAIRHNTPQELTAEIQEGYRSTLLCHLGNIALRVGRALHCDPQNGQILHDAEAMQWWKRDYDPQWEPQDA